LATAGTANAVQTNKTKIKIESFFIALSPFSYLIQKISGLYLFVFSAFPVKGLSHGTIICTSG